jgi:hypothetical protein
MYVRKKGRPYKIIFAEEVSITLQNIWIWNKKNESLTLQNIGYKNKKSGMHPNGCTPKGFLTLQNKSSPEPNAGRQVLLFW